MKDQLFIAGLSGQKLDLDRIKKKLQSKAKLENKPNSKPYPVLWTSTIEGGSTDWMNWCSHEMPHWLGDQGVILEVSRSAKIYKIDSKEDWEALCRQYGQDAHKSFAGLYCNIDWVAVQRDGYDGVWHGKGRYAPMWDVESTAWLNPKVLTIKQVVDINKGCQYDWDSDEPDGGYRPPSIIMARMIKNISDRYLNG